MVFSGGAIGNMRPPADAFQMRMHYSLYLTNLMSALDMMVETHGEAFQSALEARLATSGQTGSEVLGYIRELRNGVVHRGIDPTSGGEVIADIVCAIAPATVQNRTGNRSYAAPARLLRDIYTHCELATKPVMERFLEQDIERLRSLSPASMVVDALSAIENVPHMPDWAKEMVRTHIAPEMLAMAQNHQIEKLKDLLKPRAIGAIA